jgi:gamma-glutamyl hercynylcysteine S-oxide synthase
VRSAGRVELREGLQQVRAQTLQLIAHLQPEQWQVPYLATINPPLWEIGHIAWFQEYWCLRRREHPSAAACELPECGLPDGDAWFDSRTLDHAARWTLPLASHDDIYRYLERVLERTLDGLQDARETPAGLYFYRLALFHEQMHVEALAYTWQTLGFGLGMQLQMPLQDAENAHPMQYRHARRWQLGSSPQEPFVFDNEKWAYPINVAAFEIARQPISNAQYLQFVRDCGYTNPLFWDSDYFAKLQLEGRHMPHYWRARDGRIERQRFGVWEALPDNEAVVHVSALEAQAYCRWANLRLPSEAEWEIAAHHGDGFSWGNSVWEWTASRFEAFAGFQADPYAEYSQTSFGNTRVVRGGSYLTPRPLVHPKFRNFFDPTRTDLFVGFRTARSIEES